MRGGRVAGGEGGRRPRAPAPTSPLPSWGAIPASLLIAYLLLGIDEIGVALEEPWSLQPFAALTLANDGHVLAALEAASEARALCAGDVGGSATESTDSDDGGGDRGGAASSSRAARLFRGLRTPSFFKA